MRETSSQFINKADVSLRDEIVLTQLSLINESL